MKQFGDKMEPGDHVQVKTWAYTLSTSRVRNAADLVMGGPGVIARVIDRNAVVVRFSNGCCAPVHPTAVYPQTLLEGL